ncbi:MAG: ferritin family protein [Candidatus Brocadiae bacterium]|nr:ferritin family protein [Candidatus Brocadiia bacterium]
MPDLFSVRELIDLAIREEQTGATFYRALAQSTESEDLKEFALQVARMEDEHAAKFRDLLGRLGDYEPAGESYSGEHESYMSYLVAGRIFPTGDDGVEMARRQASDREAVETAMEMERSTLLFYHEMIRFVPEKDRPLLEEVIAEERQHVTDFARYKEEHF